MPRATALPVSFPAGSRSRKGSRILETVRLGVCAWAEVTELYEPRRDDLWFRQALMADSKAISYNDAWDGTIPFLEDEWDSWYGPMGCPRRRPLLQLPRGRRGGTSSRTTEPMEPSASARACPSDFRGNPSTLLGPTDDRQPLSCVGHKAGAGWPQSGYKDRDPNGNEGTQRTNSALI